MSKKKIGLFTLALSALLFTSGCGGDGGSNNTDVHLATKMVQSALQRIDEEVENAASLIPATDLDSAQSRQVLINLCANEASAIDCATVNAAGILTAVEPAQYHQAEGVDISSQKQWSIFSQNHQAIFSDVFKAVEGPWAVTLKWPLFDSADNWGGAVSLLLDPASLIGGAVANAPAEIKDNLLVVQTDGTIVYDTDPADIGLNTFTDPDFTSSASLQAFARHVVEESSGEGSYQFTATGSDIVVTKQASWETAALHGTEWRVVIINEETK